MIPPELLAKILFGQIPRELYSGLDELHQMYATEAVTLATSINTAWKGAGGKLPDSAEWGLLDLAATLVEHRAKAAPEPYAAARERLSLFILALDADLQKAAEVVGYSRGKGVESLVAQMPASAKALLLVGEFLGGGSAYAVKDMILKLATSREEKKQIVEAFKAELQARGRFDGKASDVADLLIAAPLIKAVNVRITKRPGRKIKVLIVGSTGTAMNFVGSVVHREGHEGEVLPPHEAASKIGTAECRLVVFDVDNDDPSWDAMADAVRRRRPTTPYIACILPGMNARPAWKDGPTVKCLVRPVSLADLEKAVRYFASLA